MKIRDTYSCARVHTLEGNSGKVCSVAYSPNGKYIVSGSDDKSLKVWDVTSEKCMATLIGHSDNVNSVAYSPDGRNIASGSFDKSVKIWDVSNLLVQAGGKKNKTTKKEKLIDSYKKVI